MGKSKKSLQLNAILNTVKQACVILFPMITFPYISRVLGVTNYGRVNFSISVVSYITLIAALGINNYGVREGARVRNDRKKLETMVNEVYSINIISTVVAYIILAAMLLFWKKLESYEALIIIQALVVIFTTIGTDWINVIFEDYLFIAIRYIACQSVAVLFMFLFVREQQDYIVYALISISGTVLANLCNVVYIRKKMDIHPKFVLSNGMKRHISPIMIMFGSSAASLIYINSDVTILGVIKGAKATGYYSVAVKIYSLIKQLLNAMLMVAIPRFSYELQQGKHKEVNQQMNTVFGMLLMFVGPVMTGLYMLSKPIIGLLAGDRYLPANGSLKVLAISLVFATVACFFIHVVMIPNLMEKQVLYATIASAVLNLVLNLIFIPQYGMIAAAATTMLSEILMVTLGVFYSRGKIKLNIGKPLAMAIVGSGWTIGTCLLCQRFISSYILVIISSVIVTGLGITCLLLVGFFKDIRNMLGKISK